MKQIQQLKLLTYIILMGVLVFSCSKEEEEATPIIVAPLDSKTITVVIYTEDSGVYTSTGKTLLFNSKLECQSWSRSNKADGHSSNIHLHYNAAANIDFNETDTIFSWSEYGPELDQASINTTCENGQGGVIKTVNTTSYFQDKNVYLRITKVE
jgi:hypothetical protein